VLRISDSAILGLLLLTGCRVGPNYHRPETSVPESWAEVSDGVTSQPVNLTQWWTVFSDPRLDSLVERAIRFNTSLQLAEARILQARAQRLIAAATGRTSSYSDRRST
jgi:multidrug efflux system outer membrane protein